MPGEDQERFEDYLELERYIEGLHEGQHVHPLHNLTAAQIRIYRMAALFHSATPDVAEPSPEFVAELHDHLLALDREDEDEPTEKRPLVKLETQRVAIQEVATQPGSDEHREACPQEPQKSRQERRHVLASLSRRRLIAGGAVAAASLAVGAGLGTALKSEADSPQQTHTPDSSGKQVYQSTALVPSGQRATWHYVTTIEQLGKGAVQFPTAGVIGYVILNDGDDPAEKDKVIGFSAACTHMGCIVQWQDADRQFHCPCHGGIFNEYGQPSSKGQIRYLAALPRLKTHIDENGNIYVEVPKIES